MSESFKKAYPCILEGMVSVRALIAGIDADLNDRRPQKIWFSAEKTRTRNGDMRYLKARSYDLGYTFEVVEPAQIDAVTEGNSHGGVVAFCTERHFAPLQEVPKQQSFYVYLDGIEDPYNFGYALRSLYAAGADGILLPERNWMTAAGIVARSSAGASERFAIFTGKAEEMISVFRRDGYHIVCADIENSVSLYQANLKNPVLLIIGGEKRGISRSVLELSDEIVRIDYGREFDGALSAASAAAVLGFEVCRQNHLS